MEYDEYIRQEEAARKEKKNKWIVWSIIGGFAITIATCNILHETRMKEGIFTKPEVGDRFIFTVKGNDRPYKLKAFTGDSVEFFIPLYETSNWRENKSESKVSELEQEGKMYNPRVTMFLPKKTVENLRDAPNVILPPLNEQGQLKTVYGRSRTSF
jgi:hypothetical protein